MIGLTRRHVFRLIGGAAVAAAGPALGGCGFKPLYGSNEGAPVADDLHTVRIAPLADRTGQKLHNYLRDRLNPYGQPGDPVYELRLSLREVTESTGIRRDETATRAELTELASFVLVELESGQAVTQGLARSSSAYNILDDSFASSVSAEDARDRALRELAEEIKLRLAAYFSAQQPT